MNPIEHNQHHCPICGKVLERKVVDWLCLHCLLIWHGDTFEPLRLDAEDRGVVDDWIS